MKQGMSDVVKRFLLGSPGRNAGCGLKLPNVVPSSKPWLGSPGRNAGCGLKRVDRLILRRLPRGSPGRNAGCGLKHLIAVARDDGDVGSPGRNAGCGLKLDKSLWSLTNSWFARQKCRVWIETSQSWVLRTQRPGSPGRNAGCGLKQSTNRRSAGSAGGSPGRNAGCGLKPSCHSRHCVGQWVRPAEMPGVD